jgi:N-acetylmuramoyl-L-alanine amidase
MGRVRSLAGLPIEQHSSPNVGGTMDAHRGIVLHVAEGSYEGTISWQLNPNQTYASGGKVTTSSTWIVGKNRGEWAQMSDSNTVAWCQRAGSLTWNSIELAGHADDRPTAWQIEACAQILAWEHREYGVPLQVADTDAERGLGHHSMDREWAGVEWGHDGCPGAGVIAAKPAIVARAKAIINPTEEEEMDAETFARILYDPVVRARMRALPWEYNGGGIPAGTTALSLLAGGYEAARVAAAKAGADPAELAAITEAARKGTVAAADELADALAPKLPGSSREEIKAALREVFADAGTAQG